MTGTKGPNWFPLWAATDSDGGCFVAAVTDIAPRWPASAPGVSGFIWHFGAETDLLNLQCKISFVQTTKRNFPFHRLPTCGPTNGRRRSIERALTLKRDLLSVFGLYSRQETRAPCSS